MARYDLAGKVALVTGGAQGIGLETARALAGRGGAVALVDVDAAAAERAAVGVDPVRAIGLGADVTDGAAVERAVAAVVERFGGLDVVVANAGIASRAATVRAIDPATFERVLEVNLLGVWRTVRAALPEVVRRRGHVVVVASVYSFMNGIGAVPYAMSKAAVEQFGRALRVELKHHGASASVAYFGFIDTEMVRAAIDRDPLVERMLASIPGPLHERLTPAAAGQAIARGIERRQPRIVRPRRWVGVSMLRGVLSPLGDARMERDADLQQALRELDGRAPHPAPATT
jgi:NAD(P)-dependent dehydrogenase (short-subunit alcohol dehydrogenase family)